MLVVMAPANAAHSTMKKIVVIGGKITDVLSAPENFVTAEEKFRARGNRKTNGLFSKVKGRAADASDDLCVLKQMA